MEYNFEFSQQESQLLLQGLGEIPLKFSINLFLKLDRLIKEQDAKNAVSISSLDFGNSAPDVGVSDAISR